MWSESRRHDIHPLVHTPAETTISSENGLGGPLLQMKGAIRTLLDHQMTFLRRPPPTAFVLGPNLADSRCFARNNWIYLSSISPSVQYNTNH